MSLLNVIFIFVLTATPVALILLLVKVIVNLRDTVYDLQDTIESLQSAVPIYHTTKLERLFDYAEKLQADKRNPFYTREIDFEKLEMETGIIGDDFVPVSIAKLIEEWHEMKQAQKQSKQL